MASAPSHSAAVWTHENVVDHFNARYVAVAGLTLMIWTHLTRLDEEATYIWNNDARVTLNKALFTMVRYFTTIAFGFHCLTLFLAQPSFEVCRGFCIFVGAAALGLIGTCDVILLLRTWAIHNRTRKSLICLVILLTVTHLPTLVLGALWMTTLHIGPSKLYPVIPGCFLETTAPRGFWPITAPSIVYNTALSGASMYKVWSYHQTQVKTPLISLLVRDGMVYYMIILAAYLCNGFFLFHKRLIVITIDGQFITWVVAVTCAQLQLNLRTAVHHVPEYVTTYYQRQVVIGALDGRLSTPHRPGVDTLIFGGTATELEHKYGDFPIESEVEQGELHCYHATDEATTTSVHRPKGTKKNWVAASVDFGTRNLAPVFPQHRRAKSFQGSPSHSPRNNVDITVIPNATTDENRSLSPTSNAHSEPSSRPVTRANTPSTRTIRSALGFNSKHNWALAKPASCFSAAAVSPKFKKQSHDPSQDGIPLNDMSGVPSPRDLESQSRGDSPRSASDPYLQVEVQVECEHESGLSPVPRTSEYENAASSVSQDGGVMETRIGVWR